MLFLSLFALLFAGPAPASEASPPAPNPTLDRSLDGDEVEALEKEYKAAGLEYRRAQRAAKKAGTEFTEPAPIEAFLPRFESAAAEGSPRALLWVGLNVDASQRSREAILATKRGAFERLVADFADHEVMEDFVKRASRQSNFFEPTELAGWLERVYEQHGDGELRARAAFELTQALSSSARKEDHEVAQEWCRRIVREFPGHKLAARAQESLDAMNYQVGRVAPDFTTQDVDGNEFKLSDYRGKVVVLDFWGFW